MVCSPAPSALDQRSPYDSGLERSTTIFFGMGARAVRMFSSHGSNFARIPFGHGQFRRSPPARSPIRTSTKLPRSAPGARKFGRRGWNRCPCIQRGVTAVDRQVRGAERFRKADSELARRTREVEVGIECGDVLIVCQVGAVERHSPISTVPGQLRVQNVALGKPVPQS